jgi:hypothetical protein
MTKKNAIKIIANLEQTISKMGEYDGMYSENSMFKRPRAKRSDLVKKKNDLIKKYL